MEILGIQIPLYDIISVAVGLFGMLLAKLAKSKQLPKAVQAYLKKLGGQGEVEKIVRKYAEIATMSPEQRRMMALEELQKLAIDKIGWHIPDSIANLIIEFVVQIVKRARK